MLAAVIWPLVSNMLTSACLVQEEQGGAGVYSADMRKKWQLEDDSWKYDIMPEIMDGRNIADFVDPDIEAQLAQLEKEEDALAAAAALEVTAPLMFATSTQETSLHLLLHSGVASFTLSAALGMHGC